MADALHMSKQFSQEIKLPPEIVNESNENLVNILPFTTYPIMM